MASPTKNAPHAMVYMDRFLAPVATSNREAYRQHSEALAALFREDGAIMQVECRGDDIPDGHVTSFPKPNQCKKDESVIAGWLIWPSKDIRDAAWEKML
ncbi:MAG: DUF1428 domain-containing protein [Pseudomonadota bacterium]